jgi:NADH:ubiquinone oxidoreductase subunit C
MTSADTPTILESGKELLASWTLKAEMPEANRLDIYIAPESLVESTRVIIAQGGWHLSAITGLDVPMSEESDGAIEVLYHFCKGAAVITLRLLVSYGMPEVASICGVIPSANLYERELIEMFGVLIDDTPVHGKLLLPDDWPDYVYPLRKSFKGLDQV